MNTTMRNQVFQFLIILLLIMLTISCEEESPLPSGVDYTGQMDTITDIEGNTYKTIGIGSQIWMAENLRTTRLNDGTIIPIELNDSIWATLHSPAKCWYNNDSIRYHLTYGPLYNFYAINTGLLCPTGWHVPESSEWKTLEMFAGGEKVAGGRLKQSDGSHWNSPNPCYMHNYQFVALPGGCRTFYDGKFMDKGNMGYWWTNISDNYLAAYCQAMSHDNTSLIIYSLDKKMGLSVRCIKD
jgi:uncharacterized protein (TIGR02145 family)